MILRRLLLDDGNGEGGGGAPEPVKQVSSTPTIMKPSVAKEAPAAAKAVTFTTDMSLLEDTDKVGFKIEDTSKPNVDVTPIVEPTRTAQPPEVKPPSEPQAKPARKPDEPSKPVAAATAQIKKEEIKSTEPAPIVPKKKGVAEPAKEYDYSGFDESEATALRQMSTTSRDFTVDLIKKNRELAQVKNGMFAQHPDAYVIDPAFRAIQEDEMYAKTEAAIWQEQLSKIEQGEEWTPLRGFDKNGNPVYGEKKTPTSADKYQVSMLMNRAYGLAEQKKGEAQHFAATYQQRVKQDSNLIQAERQKRFGWVSNPEILKETVELDNGTEQTVGDIRNSLISLFPPYMRNTLPVEVAADLFVALQIYGQSLREATKGKTVAQEQVREVVRAEPTGGSRGNAELPGKAINGVKEFSLAGMPR